MNQNNQSQCGSFRVGSHTAAEKVLGTRKDDIPGFRVIMVSSCNEGKLNFILQNYILGARVE